MTTSSRFTIASVTTLLSTAAVGFADPTVVAVSGAVTPGGGTYSAFTNPVLSANGTVAFGASIAGGTSTSGLFAGTPASVQAIALQGAAAPSGGNYGTLFTTSTVTSLTLNSTGQLAFQASLTGGTSISGVFTGMSAATLQAVALQATAAPAGGNYNAFAATGTNAATSPTLNANGQLAISSTLTGGTNASGLFVGTPGSLQTVALLGAAAPTTPVGNYATALTAPVVNRSGQVAFVSLVNSAQGVFVGTPGSVVAAAYGASPVGGTYGSFTSYQINNASQISVQSTIAGGSATGGIFVGTIGSALQTVATIGSVAPGTGGGTYSVFSNQSLDGAGLVTFTGNLTGGTATSGIFQGTAGAVKAVALAGGTTPDGATYASFASAASSNASGQVAFVANLTGTGVTAGTNSIELDAGTPGALNELVRTGDVIDVNPDPLITDNRTVSGIALLVSGGGQDGRGTSLNDSRLLVYRLTFTDTSTGIFTSVVPEPSSLSLLALAGVGLLRKRASAK